MAVQPQSAISLQRGIEMALDLAIMSESAVQQSQMLQQVRVSNSSSVAVAPPSVPPPAPTLSSLHDLNANVNKSTVTASGSGSGKVRGDQTAIKPFASSSDLYT